MTTSGTYSYTVTRDDIINAALRALGVLDKSSVADSTDLTNGSQALNLLLKQWSDNGAPLWATQWVHLPTVAGKASYTIGPTGDFNLLYRPTRLISAFLRDNNTSNDFTLQVISRQEYEQLGDKTSQSVINQVYYDAQLPLGVLYFYNVPIDTNYTIWLSVQRPIQDVVTGTDNFDIPQEWFLPLKWCLAEELFTEYEVPEQRYNIIASKAAALRDKAFDWQQEEASVFFTIDPQAYYLGHKS